MDIKNILCSLSLLSSISAFGQMNLGTLSWGLKNTGSPQQVAIDHYTSGNISGVVNEDIRLPTPVAQSRKVIVGVLDTGIDYNHPQLKDALAGKGFNAITGTDDAGDSHGHGTHISGIIAARINSSGFQGVSQNALILPVKVIQTGPNAPIRPQSTEQGEGTALTENVAKGLVYAIQNGAEVINLSMAWPSSIHSKAVDLAMALAVQKNVIVVSSAGNDSTTANVYPCIYDNVICVGSHGPDGSFSHFSNFGSMVDVLAPGISILSSWPMNKSPATFAGQVGYEFRNGTSMSAPFVSGAIAELLSRGYSPQEAKNRIILGSRTTSPLSQFSSKIVGTYSENKTFEIKLARFGNLDIKNALAIVPSPLILPTHKKVLEIEWDGVAEEISVPISFTNQWIASGATQIKIQDQIFKFNFIEALETVSTPLRINIGKNPESLLHLIASVHAENFVKDGIDIPVQLIRVLKTGSFPADSSVVPILGLNTREFKNIRSIENTGSNTRADLLFIKATKDGIDYSLVQGNKYLETLSISGSNRQLLKAYRLPDESYALIFTHSEKPGVTSDFLIQKLDRDFKLLSEVKLGTDATTLPENFVWIPYKGSYTLFWISLGFTPKLDQPKFDYWSTDFDSETTEYHDLKMPRAFFLDGKDLHIMPLTREQLPLQIFPDGRLLISEGSNYFQTYKILRNIDGKIASSITLKLPEYRMLIGLESGTEALELDGAPSKNLVLSGSTSQNLRVTGLGEIQFDQILQRSTQLDTLVSLIGAYQFEGKQNYFVQTHYNLQFFSSDSPLTLSTTINRYSYIPSMVFGKTFFQTIVQNGGGHGMPAVYTPASSETNSNISEIVVADIEKQKLIRPASLRFQLKDQNCIGLGNLIAASHGMPAKQVFICGNDLIHVPLTIHR